MTSGASVRERWRRSVRVETGLAVATPVARMLLVGSVVMAVLFCTANLAVVDDLATPEAIQLALHSATVPALMFAFVAGAYSASTDRRFGFVDQRLSSDSERLRWLVGKAAVQAVVGGGYGLLGAITAVIASSVVFSVRGESFDVTDPNVARALIGVLLAPPLLSILGVLIGSLFANTPAVVAGILVWSLVVEPPVILGLPAIGRWLPTAGALALTNTPNPDLASQLAGGLSLVLQVGIVFALVRWKLARIDV